METDPYGAAGPSRAGGVRAAAVGGLLLALAACGGDSQGGARGDDPLETAATSLVRFLQGAGPFEAVRLAERVSLCVAPEGGGECVRLERERLSDPAAWVATGALGDYPLAPPPGLTELTVVNGTHFNCLEYPIASRFPLLASNPHVGTRLARGPGEYDSCLATWNLTVVFHPTADPPEVVAVIYDQWEW